MPIIFLDTVFKEEDKFMFSGFSVRYVRGQIQKTVVERCSRFLPPRSRVAIVFLLLEWMSGQTVSCRAQSSKPISLHLDLDFRSRLATSGQSRSGLFSSTLVIEGRLNPAWRVRYEGRQTNSPNLTGAGDAMRFDRFIAQELVLEKEWGAQRLQLGLTRLPFGIYNHQETYASGLIDWPLARVDYQFISVDHGVPGIAYSGGTSHLQFETAWFGGQSAGVWNDLTNVGGTAIRLQTYQSDFILGYSRWDGHRKTIPPGLPDGKRFGVHLNGLDLRYTRPHLLVRGEIIGGEAGGVKTLGWYLDGYYHLPKYEKITFTGRLEEFKPDPSLPQTKQITLGVRYTLNSRWILSVNWRRNNGPTYAMSWTPPTGRSGDFFFQAYYKLRF